MPRLVSRVTAWSLVVGVVLLLSMTTSSAVVHELTHAGHHTAGMHTSTICAWLCAAGTVLDSAVVTFQAELSPIALITFHHSAPPSIEVCQTSSSRAPPSFSL